MKISSIGIRTVQNNFCYCYWSNVCAMWLVITFFSCVCQNASCQSGFLIIVATKKIFPSEFYRCDAANLPFLCILLKSQLSHAEFTTNLRNFRCSKTYANGQFFRLYFTLNYCKYEGKKKKKYTQHQNNTVRQTLTHRPTWSWSQCDRISFLHYHYQLSMVFVWNSILFIVFQFFPIFPTIWTATNIKRNFSCFFEFFHFYYFFPMTLNIAPKNAFQTQHSSDEDNVHCKRQHTAHRGYISAKHMTARPFQSVTQNSILLSSWWVGLSRVLIFPPK